MDFQSISKIIESTKSNKFRNTKYKNILITGCSGFIGNYLVNSLLNLFQSKDLFIIGIDTIKPNLLINNGKFKFIKKDLFKLNSLSLKTKVDLIIHLAGIPSPVFYKKKPLETIYLNSDLTKVLLELAKKNRARFIYFSSSEIYGNPEEKFIPTPESYAGRVSSISDRACYDESKRLGETFTWIYKEYYNVDSKIIRPFNFYGNGMKQNDRRVIPQFFSTALNNNEILIYGNGRQTRTYCHIIDAITQILNICFLGKDFVYNVGNSSGEISAIDLANIISKKIEKKVKVKFINYPKDYPSFEPRRRCPDINKIKREFKYKQKISLSVGLDLFYAFAKKNY